VSINALSQGKRIMKKVVILVTWLIIYASCNNAATLENKADSLEKQADSTGNRVSDSVKQGRTELKEKIENQFDKKDTAGN
jgi:hypothetical protein